METPTRNILIYDGHCPFCSRQAERLKHIAGGALHLESFQDPAVLARYPKLTYEDCMKEIKLAAADGRILGGAEAIFHSLSLNPLYRPLRWIYPIPLLKQMIDFFYRLVAQNRYKISARECPSGACKNHGGFPQKA